MAPPISENRLGVGERGGGVVPICKVEWTILKRYILCILSVIQKVWNSKNGFSWL